MTKPQLILIGAGGHSHACIDVIEQNGHFQIAGLVGLPEQLRTNQLGYPVIGSDNNLSEMVHTYHYALITIGQLLSAERRILLYQLATRLGFQLPVVISPAAHVSRYAEIGAGTIVMHGAIVNAGAKIGVNCIINSRALIEHDAVVGDHCHISTGAILNGSVMVGAESFIGSGGLVKEGISIGRGCLVGMGLVVRRNLIDNSYFKGQGKSEQ